MKILSVPLQFKRPYFGHPDEGHPTDQYTRLVETDLGWFLIRYELCDEAASSRFRAAQPTFYALSRRSVNVLVSKYQEAVRSGPDARLSSNALGELDDYIDRLASKGVPPEEMGARAADLVAARLLPYNAPGAVPPFGPEAGECLWWIKPSWEPQTMPWTPARVSYDAGELDHQKRPSIFVKTFDRANPNRWQVYGPAELLRERWAGPVVEPSEPVALPPGADVPDFAMMLVRLVRSVRRGVPAATSKICGQAEDLLRRKGKLSVLR